MEIATSPTVIDLALHATEAGSLEQRIMELALELTGATNGAIFLWDPKAGGLAVHFHVVEGLVIDLPEVILKRRKKRRNGIALWVLDHNEPYVCHDTADDPQYASYFLDVLSVVAVPIAYQGRAIGVISVSSKERQAFGPGQVTALTELAVASSKFLRRAQMARAMGPPLGRAFLIKGLSPEWLEVERQLERVSPTDAAVLIQGESGTGKELVAKAIHFNSARSEAPLVSVNCAAIPETLLESILFGHVKGAFTGASFTKVGEFQQAHGGTLFLDEIGDLPLSLQAKLLRAAESGEIRPLGSNDPPVQVDVRLVCASHRNLPGMVRRGEFRDDLYYRLSVITIELPSLRSYKDNLEILVQAFLLEATRKHHKEVSGLSPEAMGLLQSYNYPGNVRELRNVIEHAVIMTGSGSPMLEVQDLPRTLRATDAAPDPNADPNAPQPPASPGPERRATLKEQRERWLAPLERRYLKELLEACGGNVRRAAQEAGVNAVTLYRLLKKRGLRGG